MAVVACLATAAEAQQVKALSPNLSAFDPVSGPNAPATFVSSSPGASRVKGASLIFSQAVPRLILGQTFTFAVELVDETGVRSVPVGVKWASTNPSAASVSQTGVVRAVADGRAYIIASAGSREVRVRVSVLTPPQAPPRLASLELVPSTGAVEEGLTLQFAITARLSSGGVDPAAVATYESSDTNVARISSNGLLTARKAGAVTVTARTGTVSAQASVRIGRSRVVSLAVSPAELSLFVGDTLTLAVKGARRDGSAVASNEVRLSARRGTFRGLTYVSPATPGVDTITATTADSVTSKASVTVAPKIVVNAPAPGNTIALRVERFDNADTTVLISNGIPLAPGMLREADVAKARVVVGGNEVASRIVALRGWHADGSLKSVLVQFMAPSFSTPYAAELQLGTGRGLNRTTVVAPFGAPVAVALPTSADYLISTGIVGPTIRVDQVNGATYTNWQAEFMSFGDKHWLTSDVNGGSNYRGDNYYDRVLNHYAFWVRGGGTKWFHRATMYATSYLAKEALAWQPHFAQMEGVEVHYWLTGYDRAFAAIVNQATWMMSAFPTRFISWGGQYQEGRIQARVLMALTIATELGMSNTQRAPGGVNWDYHKGARDAVDAIIATQFPDGRRHAMECGRDFPFMAGLVNNALIFYYERLNRDARIPGVIKSNLDYLWRADWVPSARAFKYWDAATPGGTCDVNNSGSTDGPAPDLNLMVVVPYGWYGKHFAAPEYIRRGEEIFSGSSGRTAVYISKQFNQQYYLTHNYLWYRR
ncbi:MAG: Ig-like domain-containing protein [Gemmatimonadaceae bacterium]|nr:Ig-like domain-containing protein [Gemmatimonadaceae bacterium]